MPKNIIKDLASLKRVIKKSVNEATLQFLPEEATAPVQQGTPPAAPAPAPAGGQQQAAGGTPVSPGKVAAGQAGVSDPGADLQKGTITLDMVVERLNAIRSGRSFKDENISQQMQAYFNDLNDNERLALYAFLKGISQIVTGEIQGQAAPTPQTASPAVEMVDSGEGEIRHIKPNVIRKGPAPSSAPRAPSPENTAAPTPIVAKQR
jgi:hypothetical protein